MHIVVTKQRVPCCLHSSSALISTLLLKYFKLKSFFPQPDLVIFNFMGTVKQLVPKILIPRPYHLKCRLTHLARSQVMSSSFVTVKHQVVWIRLFPFENNQLQTFPVFFHFRNLQQFYSFKSNVLFVTFNPESEIMRLYACQILVDKCMHYVLHVLHYNGH